MASRTEKAHVTHLEDSQEYAEQTMGVGEYLMTRVSTLKPPMDKAANPFQLLGSLTRRQWLFFSVSLHFSVPEKERYISNPGHGLGCLVRLGMGCIRLLHCQPDDYLAGRRLWKI
jgi:hypothetical protein